MTKARDKGKLYKMNKFNQKMIVKDPRKENIRRETRNKLMTLKRDTIIALKIVRITNFKELKKKNFKFFLKFEIIFFLNVRHLLYVQWFFNSYKKIFSIYL